MQRGGRELLAARGGPMQLSAHTAFTHYIIEQTSAICNFFTDWLFSNKICRASSMKDLYNILKCFLPALIPFNVNRKVDVLRKSGTASLSLLHSFLSLFLFESSTSHISMFKKNPNHLFLCGSWFIEED